MGRVRYYTILFQTLLLSIQAFHSCRARSELRFDGGFLHLSVYDPAETSLLFQFSHEFFLNSASVKQRERWRNYCSKIGFNAFLLEYFLS
jgi:hypothetical protein